ncbi:MCP four helix bundle domain-containing protein [Flavobacterium sp. WC2509]|uniref:MCP four helix bundle domain-containing protein n=1 Tax=Flavobacterium sp. WC2509 TaxID=3461406 RepID=UPI004045102E
MSDLKKYTNKTKAAFILLIVMVIILLSNFNTLHNSKKTNEDINAIFNDRLVVEHYIFQYANELHSIKANAINPQLNELQKMEGIAIALGNMQNIDALYSKTVLTANEGLFFKSFLSSCTTIKERNRNKNWNQIVNSSNQALQTLGKLSHLQIKEGKSKLDHSNALHSGNNSLGELEIALLVILSGITVYLLMAKKDKIKVKIPEAPSLN